jgi:hypothetical protein
VISTTNPAKKLLENLPTKIRRKGSENSQNGKIEEASRTLEESHRTFYTYHERFIQGLACLLNIRPSLKISPEALKLVL